MSTLAKEQAHPVCMRIKQSNHDWLKVEALTQDRSVTWIVNKLIEQAKRLQEASHAQPA
jgi:predicted HicB family RNase H-like nuclease